MISGHFTVEIVILISCVVWSENTRITRCDYVPCNASVKTHGKEAYSSVRASAQLHVTKTKPGIERVQALALHDISHSALCCRVSAIFSEGFTENLGNDVYFK